ncbi:MAG: ubiquinone/menaquinone biosynthesis C-methylase UbiE [Candidatus Azotimanducaceae bacterium]|jgi:ubiquinone/menaquinone biosynthesis C-methylase UbiE
MAHPNRRPEQLNQNPENVNQALQQKLDKKLEEAGLAYDKVQANTKGDQQRIVKLRTRAKSLAHQVLSRQPDNDTALNLLGRLALDEGNLVQAKGFIDLGLDYDPDSISLLYSRAHIYLAAQDYDRAIELFEFVEKNAPKTTRAIASLAYTKTRQGLFVEAFEQYRIIIRQDPTDPQIRSKLFECIRNIKADCYSPELERDLIAYLNFIDVDHNDLAGLISSLLIHKYNLKTSNAPLEILKLANDQLLITALKKLQFCDPIIEEFLTACRQCLLQQSINNGEIDSGLFKFIIGLSIQGATNEFVYSTSIVEENVLADLRSTVSKTITNSSWNPAELVFPLLLISMYSLLHHEKFCGQLIQRSLKSWPTMLQTVIQQHLLEPQREFELQRSIQKISKIQEPTSIMVRAQYEENPYPRWKAFEFATKTDYAQALASELPGFTPPTFLSNQTIKVLVAGCGTGRHALQVAQHFRNVEVTAIDLSAASLAYGTKKARELKITNVEFYQADLLEMSAFKDRFHIIECSGVLHHMTDPLSGWQSLVKLLEPGGLIKTALYSTRARRIVSYARELIEENQLSTSPEHIRLFRQAILDDLISGDFSNIKKSQDFYNLSGCRDLLFNIQEHHYTPLQLASAIKSLDLKFLGFANLPIEIKQQFSRRFPDDYRRLNLTHWDQIEADNPEIFSGMFQFYCQREGSAVTQFEQKIT